METSFARGKWDENEWLKFKSLRFDYVHGFKQEADHIVNESPEGISDEELYASRVTEVYSSIVYREKLGGFGETALPKTVEVSATMSFDHLMAPLIVLTPQLDQDDEGRYAFKKHVEVVLYNEGINVWHYRYENGQLKWYLAAFARAPFEPKRKYTLKVKVQAGRFAPRMTIECGKVKFGYEDEEIPASFYAGVTGCEGRNRFYDFKAVTSDERVDFAADA